MEGGRLNQSLLDKAIKERRIVIRRELNFIPGKEELVKEVENGIPESTVENFRRDSRD